MRTMARAFVVLGTLALAAVACGGEADEGGAAPQAGSANYGTGQEITASNTAFDRKELTLESGGQVRLVLRNEDDGIPHNLSIYEGSDAKGDAVFKGDLVTGPETMAYSFTAPAAGTYYFQCDVHPEMNGTVTVE